MSSSLSANSTNSSSTTTNNYFHQLNSSLCLLIGWPANLLLIWLIICRKNQQGLRIWSCVLLQTAIFDLIAPLNFALIHPVAMADGQNVFYVLDGPFSRAPQPIALLLYYFYSFWNEFTKNSVAVQFIFRWLFICRNKELSTRDYVFLLSIPAGMALSIVLLIHWGLCMDGSMNLPMGSIVDQTVVFSIQQNSIFLLIVTVTLMVTNLVTYSIILLAILLIWKKSRQTLMIEQSQFREINRQIGLILLIQAAIPMALYLVPIGLTLIYNTIGLARPQWLSIVFIQSWPSVVYPIATMLILKEYRRILRKSLCKWIVLISQTTVNSFKNMVALKAHQVQINSQIRTIT